jgi:hypothetical protein
MTVALPAAVLFWRSFRKEPGDGCWLWTDTINDHGYGVIRHEKRRVRAHRYSWELHYGPIPDGLLVCHRCDVPRCVRPDHLFVGTHADNRADCVAKGRANACHTPRPHHNHARGERASNAKLTERDVLAIRAAWASGERQTDIATRFRVTAPNVSAITRRLTWRHIP